MIVKKAIPKIYTHYIHGKIYVLVVFVFNNSECHRSICIQDI